MADAINAAKPLQPFTTIKYVTKDGENVTATKNNGIVTLVGDKNGTREMPLNDFMTKELVNNVKPLERTPGKDTVELSTKAPETAPAEKTTAPVKAEVPAKEETKTPAPAAPEAPKAEAPKKLDTVA